MTALAGHPPAGPAPTLVLGIGGLAPFVGLALLAVLVPTWYAIWLDALAKYGAVILAFIGAVHWGHAMRSDAQGRAAWLRYGWSVLPALVGWLSLQLPVWSSLRLQAAMLVTCLAVDRAMQRVDPRHPFPVWYLRLRLALTLVAAGALLAASVA